MLLRFSVILNFFPLCILLDVFSIPRQVVGLGEGDTDKSFPKLADLSRN
jgi:hypothetical protein